jgi:hypothetical protein
MQPSFLTEIRTAGCRSPVNLLSVKDQDSGWTLDASTNLQSPTRFSRSIHKEGGIFFALYSRGFNGFDIFLTVLRSPYFPVFQPFILCLPPDSPFYSDLVRNASGKLYPCSSRSYVKLAFIVVVLSLRSVLESDLCSKLFRTSRSPI